MSSYGHKAAQFVDLLGFLTISATPVLAKVALDLDSIGYIAFQCTPGCVQALGGCVQALGASTHSFLVHTWQALYLQPVFGSEVVVLLLFMMLGGGELLLVRSVIRKLCARPTPLPLVCSVIRKNCARPSLRRLLLC